MVLGVEAAKTLVGIHKVLLDLVEGRQSGVLATHVLNSDFLSDPLFEGAEVDADPAQ